MIGAAYFVASGIYTVVTVTVKTAATVYGTQYATQKWSRNPDSPEVFNQTYKRFTQLYYTDHITTLAQEVLQRYQPKSAVSNIAGTGTSKSSRVLYEKLAKEKNPHELYKLLESYISNPKNNGKKLYSIIKNYICNNTAEYRY